VGSPDPVVVGYWYSADFHYILGYGEADAITEFRADDRVAWTGSQTANGDVSINQPYLFGGESREGGIVGTMRVRMGASDQSNSGFPGTAPVPAYRGLLSVVFSGRYAAMNPYMKPWAWRLKRILKGWHNDSVWYSAKATVTIGGIDHMNPAHIIYQCITDPEWGMGYPTSAIDDDAFTIAADDLYDEGFGISITWNQQGKVESFLKEILDHIHGVLRHDPTTGRFVLKLVRDDYDPEDLDEFDQSAIIQVDEYSRIGWGETVNEVTVKYVDQTNGKVAAVTVHDIANIQSQGALISKTQNYVGIGSYDLAVKVAMRDLKLASSPLAKFKLKIRRSAWRLLPGDVFKVSFPKLGIESVVLRVIDASIGTIDSNIVSVGAIEDVFALPSASYVAQEPIGWEDPSNEPEDVTTHYITEATYYSLARNLPRADLDYIEDDDCYIAALAAKPTGDALTYRLWTRTGSDDYADKAPGTHCPIATITPALIKESTSTFAYTGGVNIEAVRAGSYAYIENDGDRYEIVRVDSVDEGASEITVTRGVIDTVPQNHDAGSLIYFAQGFEATDRVTYLPAEEVNVKFQTKTGRGVLDLDDATEQSVTLAQRQFLPYPPGQFQIKNQAYPVWINGQLTVQWAHRDRLQQTAGIVDQDEASIGPEAGTTYTINVYDVDDNLLHSQTGETGTSWTYATATEQAESANGEYNYRLRVTVTAVRDALDSWHSHDHIFNRAGYGLCYGYYYGEGV
jgi:hypothetical protein